MLSSFIKYGYEHVGGAWLTPYDGIIMASEHN